MLYPEVESCYSVTECSDNSVTTSGNCASAPAGCHQYFTGSAYGMLWSPNFRRHPSTTSQGLSSANNPNYKVDLMGQDLQYCIRREMNMCCILYQVCNQDPDGVALTAAAGGDAADTIKNGGAGTSDPGWSFSIDCTTSTVGTATGRFHSIGLIDEDCTADYVEIPDSSTGVKLRR